MTGQAMTERLYYTDATLLEFEANVVAFDGDSTRVVLDRTAFYPTSGGQPHDLGTLGGVAVLDVVDDDARIVHVLAEPIAPGAVHGVVDAARRRDHMEQHTAQHLLSALAADVFGWETVSVHFGAAYSTIEFAVPEIRDAQLENLFSEARAVIAAALPVTVSFEDASSAFGLRKGSAREGMLRVVTIPAYDRSACGGTHLNTTSGIGGLVPHGTERMRGNVRVAYLAGGRVLRHLAARDALVAGLAAELGCGEDELAELIPRRQQELAALRKQVTALESEVAAARLRALLEATSSGVDGVTRVVHHATDESPTMLRAMAQGAGVAIRCVVLLVSGMTLFLGTSADSGVDAGACLKPALAEVGGRGGGSARLAQGTVPDGDALGRVVGILGVAGS